MAQRGGSLRGPGVLNGVDVTAVSHFGRTIPAHLCTALVTRDQTCVVPGCDVRWPLEIDHIVGVGDKGLTCCPTSAVSVSGTTT